MPDIAVEVISPDDSLGDILEKTGFYLRNGVEIVWAVDPESEQVSVFRRGEHPLTLSEGDVLTGDPVLEGFKLPLSDLFAVLHEGFD